MADRSKLWDSLYREHAPALLRYLEHRFARAGPPEDLLQDTFLRAIRGTESLEQAESPRAWLFGIARHVGLTALRKNRPHAAIPPTIAADGDAAADPRQELVREAIERLSPVLRETLELRLRLDLSYDEIAGVLHIPVGTVRSRLHHAVRRLRDEVSDGGPPSPSPPEDHR